MIEHDESSISAAETPRAVAEDRVLSILGVRITDVDRSRAVAILQDILDRNDGRSRSALIVNAHTLNLAATDRQYREVLNAADYVFGDGTGVRWAARLQGVRVRDNLVGTDLMPQLFRATANRGYRYFLLGATEPVISRAAQYAAAAFPGWTRAGYHHGYVTDGPAARDVVDAINQSAADLLLVGMGNPLQERWIHEHRQELAVPLSMAVGGLFHYWAGDLRRASPWLRRCGAEWLGILWQQPQKARRYLLGNPRFLWHIFREHWRHRGGE
jgi:N-acetylglucosaminyldiphosphoundecaprenol N-acetyl-beta-D-mannosaminyltransferase